MSDKRGGLFQGPGSGNKRNYNPSHKNTRGKDKRDGKIEEILFRDKENHLRRELLVEDAQFWANRMAKRVSFTQLRKFYSEALALKSKMEEKVGKRGKEEGFKDMEALIGMLISKAHYSRIKSRYYRIDNTYENEELFNFINSCVTAIHSAQDFNDFVLFFEAVLGFYPRKN